MSDERARLIVGVTIWVSGEEGVEALADVELVDADEVRIEIRGNETVGVYMSRAAAKELGDQLIAESRKDWDTDA